MINFLKKNKKDNSFLFASLISTFFKIGNIKYAPGTFGSIIAVPIFIFFTSLILYFNSNNFIILLISYIIYLLLLTILGYFSIEIYIKHTRKKDPSEVVIDEVIGQTIALMIPTLIVADFFISSIDRNVFNNSISFIINFVIFILPLLLFRIFDILKPGLIGYFDTKVEGVKGIIMDDVIAGIYAGFISGVVIILVLYLNI